jgi:hypothetical protein
MLMENLKSYTSKSSLLERTNWFHLSLGLEWNQVHYLRFEVFTAVTMKNGVFWDVTPCDSVNTDVSEEPSTAVFGGNLP